jgi:hypothetical protein
VEVAVSRTLIAVGACEEIRIVASRRRCVESALCPICGEPARAHSYVHCPRCAAPHHVDCWTYNQGCAIYGCGARSTTGLQTATVRPWASFSSELGSWSQRALVGVVGVVVGVGAVLAAVAFLAFLDAHATSVKSFGFLAVSVVASLCKRDSA